MEKAILFKGFRNEKTERDIEVIFTGGHRWKLMDLPAYRDFRFPELMVNGIAEAMGRSKPNDIPGAPVHQTVTGILNCPFKVKDTTPVTLNLTDNNLKSDLETPLVILVNQ
jgi:hypothetical protein